MERTTNWCVSYGTNLSPYKEIRIFIERNFITYISQAPKNVYNYKRNVFPPKRVILSTNELKD